MRLTLAWNHFYRVYDALIRRFVVAQGVRNSDVEDCRQEVWMEVVTRLVEFERPADRPGLRAWLYTLVRSKAANLARDRGRQAVTSLIDTAEPAAAELDPASLIEQEWEVAFLESVLQELQRRLSKMRLLERRPVKEVSELMEITPEQVRYRHHRSMQKLHACLEFFRGEEIGGNN